jgi:hypothetical protein
MDQSVSHTHYALPKDFWISFSERYRNLLGSFANYFDSADECEDSFFIILELIERNPINEFLSDGDVIQNVLQVVSNIPFSHR